MIALLLLLLATAAAVVLNKSVMHEFDRREQAERYAAQFGGKIALPDTDADREDE